MVDDAGRVTDEQWFDSSENLLRTISTTYDASNRITLVQDFDESAPIRTLESSVKYENFDGANRARLITNTISGLANTAVISQAFDAAGNTNLVGGAEDCAERLKEAAKPLVYR